MIEITISANGTTSATNLPPGEWNISIVCASWGSCTVAIEGADPGETDFVEQDVASANYKGVITGDNDIRFVTADYNSSAITVTLRRNNYIEGLLPAVIVQQSPVAENGQIPGGIIIGDSYLDTHDRAFEWFIDPLDFDVATSSCRFGGNQELLGRTGQTWNVEGTVSAVTVEGDPKWKLSFDWEDAGVTEELVEGRYNFTVAVISPTLEQITRVTGKVDVKYSFTQVGS
jgi:hypothetical protein